MMILFISKGVPSIESIIGHHKPCCIPITDRRFGHTEAKKSEILLSRDARPVGRPRIRCCAAAHLWH